MDNKKFVVGFTESDIEYLFNKSTVYVNYSALNDTEKKKVLNDAQDSLDYREIRFHIVENIKLENPLWVMDISPVEGL